MLKSRIPLLFLQRWSSELQMEEFGWGQCGWGALMKKATCRKDKVPKDLQVEPELPRIEVPYEHLGALSPAPPHILDSTTALIRQVPKAVTQQGTDPVGVWELIFTRKSTWENPLMGWTSASDPMAHTAIKFSSREDAVRFACKHGWSYEAVIPIKDKPLSPSNYGVNFSWDKRTRVSTK